MHVVAAVGEGASSPVTTEVAMDDAGLMQGSEGPDQLQGGFHGLLGSCKVPGLGGIPQAAPRAPLQRQPSLHHWLPWTPDVVVCACLIQSQVVVGCEEVGRGSRTHATACGVSRCTACAGLGSPIP